MEETAAAADAAPSLLSALPLPPSDDTESSEEEEEERGGGGRRRRRSMCYGGCGRPSSVCICSYLPTQLLSTSTQVILLHHPHALKRSSTTLSTLPPLVSSLLNLHPIPGRKLRLGSHPLLDSLSCRPHSRPALFLFPSLPSSTSLPLSRWARQTPLAHRASPVLVVFDGTWTQAREMVAASLPFLSGFATHVAVGDCDERAEGPSSYESELAVRKEPFKGCVSTMEAVARALRVLEPDEAVGVEVEERLVGVLRAMVEFQTRHFKPALPRIKTKKKKEMRKQGKESG